KQFILQSCEIISGSLSDLFGGALHSPRNAASFIDTTHVPNHSVCFWRPNSDLTHTVAFGKHKYHYTDLRHDTYFAYVGLSQPAPVIPKGSIVRMSLARWWSPQGSDSKACYLQI